MSDNQSTPAMTPAEPPPPPKPRGRDPFAMLSDMEEMMDRMLGRRWSSLARPLRRMVESPGGWAPQVDMYEEGTDLVVKAELPGVTKDDVDVSLENGDLVIKGERKAEKEVKEEHYYRMERSFGSFYRRLPMPEGLQADQISATFTDGVLEVRAPKPTAAEPSPTKIQIT
jgi:HSP20 family protein